MAFAPLELKDYGLMAGLLVWATWPKLRECHARFSGKPYVPAYKTVEKAINQDVRRIVIDTAASVVIRPGKRAFCSVDASRELADGLAITQMDGTLRIAAPDRVESSEIPEVTIEVSNLSELVVGAGADIVLQGLELPFLTIDVQDGGTLSGDGNVPNLFLSAKGDVDVELTQLYAEDVEANLSTNSDIEFSAGKTLRLKLEGAAEVTVRGNPDVESFIKGQGRVNFY